MKLFFQMKYMNLQIINEFIAYINTYICKYILRCPIYIIIFYFTNIFIKKVSYSHNSFLCIQLIDIPKAINGENGYV